MQPDGGQPDLAAQSSAGGLSGRSAPTPGFGGRRGAEATAGWEVETHFGMLKKNLHYTRLRLRGWAKATLEIGCLATVLNLTRLAGLEVEPI